MSHQENLDMDILFAGATRPAMMFGVTYSFAILNGMFSLLLFLAVANPFYIAVAIPGHMIGYLVCIKDPRTFEVFFVWLQTMAKCRNRMFWKVSTYTPH